MAQQNVAIRRFNTGIVSPTALSRVDYEAMSGALEELDNYLILPTGAIRPRPGFERMATGNSACRFREFISEFNDSSAGTYMLELRASTAYVWSDGARTSRPTQNYSITNGDFSSAISTGWTATTPSGTSAATSAGNLILTASTTDVPTVTQGITPTGGDYHAATIVIARGPVYFRVGSSAGEDDVFGESPLDTGTHHLQWPDQGSNEEFFLYFSSETPNVQRIVDSVTVASAGDLAVAHPWGASDLDYVRFCQIGDVLYCGMPDHQQRQIEQRANDSWSVVNYETSVGPYQSLFEHREPLSASATTGNITVTSSDDVFRSAHVGSIWQTTHNTQTQTETFNGADQQGDYIRISGGEDDDRTIDVTIDKTTGSGNMTVKLQRAFGDPTSWVDWSGQSWAGTADVSTNVDETSDDRIVFVRAVVATGDYTSGSATVTLFSAQGETLGTFRVTAYSSATSVSAEVLDEIGDTAATTLWREPEWSDYQGWPSVPIDHDGRLGWASGIRVWLSETDNYYSFDEEIEGDSAPIQRTVGGPVSNVKWATSVGPRIMMGSSLEVRVVEANEFEERLAFDNVKIRPIEDIGSHPVQARRIDSAVLYVDRTGYRPMGVGPGEFSSSFKTTRFDFLIEALIASKIKEIAVQRRPHTRVWYLTEGGQIYVFTYEPGEDIQAWATISSPGMTFKALGVEPIAGAKSDRVWVVVEDEDENAVVWRMAGEDGVGIGDVNYMADDYVEYTGLGSATLTGLSHLNNEYLAVWADGAPVEVDSMVSSGSWVHSDTVTNAVAGRPYKARAKSVKLAYSEQGTSLLRRKSVQRAGVIGADICLDGLAVGVISDGQEGLPFVEPIIRGEPIARGVLHAQLDYDMENVPGSPDTDCRLVIEQTAPYPGTICAAVMRLSGES